MAKKMYNARPPADSAKVREIQEFYKNVFPKIERYESKVYAETKKNEVPFTLMDKIAGVAKLLVILALLGLGIYLAVLVIQYIQNPFLIGLLIFGIVAGIPLLVIRNMIKGVAKESSQPQINIKFPLKAEQAKFNKLLGELGEELGCGSKLDVFINTRPSSISFKKTLPHHILLRGDNDDKSKRSFLLETTDDEITVLLPDEAGVYKYDKKQKYSDPNMPDANMPRYIAEIGDNFL